MNEDNDIDNNDDINIANTSTSPSPDTITNIPSSLPLDTPITLTELQHQPQNGFIDTFNPLKLRANPQQEVQPSSFTQSQLSSSNLTQKFHSQLKLIDERSESTRLEHEAQLKQLQAIESTLQLDQRLTHSNREIKKNAYKDLTEMCLINFDSSTDKNEFIETFSPWIKYCIEETNTYVLSEALNFFITFNTMFPEQNENCIKDFIDNFERIVSYGVASINECCRRIVFMFIKERKSFSNMLNMLMRCLNNNSIKLLKFVIDVYAELIDERMVNDVYLKGVFEKFIRLNDGIVGNSKYSEKRKLYVKIISLIYEHIEDDVSVVKKHNKINSIKEIEGILKKIKKIKGKTLYRLYPNDVSSAEGGDAQTVHEHNTQQDVYDSNNNNNNSGVNGNGNQIQNTISNSNNNDSNVPPEEVSDILVVFPDCFYEYHFKTNFQEKLSILEDTNKRFQHVKHIKPSNTTNTNTTNISNYNDIYKITNISIDDSNILIHFEGIKLLKHLCRLLSSNINQHKLKLLLESSFHKFNNKKSLIKNELFSLFDTIIEHNCFASCDVFISFALSFCTTNKKITAIVKQNILEYLKLLLKRKVHIIQDKHLLSFSKSVVDVILNEASSTVKDVCSDLLVVIKGKIKDAKAFEKVVKELPSYRKKVIEEGNDNLNGHVVVSEGNYKRNLRKVKSSLSVNRRERSVNKSFKADGDSGSKSKRKDSRLSAVSTPKKNEKKFKGRKIQGGNKRNDNEDNGNGNDSSVVGSKKEVVNNIKQIKHVGDTVDNEIDSSLYNNNNNDTHMNDNTQMNMNMNDNDEDNGDDNNEVLTKEVKLHTNNNNNNIVNTNYNNNNNNESHLQTSLSQSIHESNDTLEQEISQFSLEQINKYSNSVTANFLSFINKLTLSSTSENLYTHFQIIFLVLSKLIDRIQELVLTDTSVLLSLIKRILRVVVLAPCINDIEGCTPIESSELEAFLSKVKKAYGNNDAFYAMMLEYLLYFSQKDEKTFKSMNSKTAVDYYLKYIYNEYYKYEKGRQVKEAFIKFIETTEVLDENEKEEYMKMYLGEEYVRNGDVSLRIDISNIEHVQEQSVITTMNNNNVNSGNKRGNETDGNDEFLVNKIKESQKLIDEKKKENEQLREKIKLIEQRRKAHMNKLNIANNNNNSSNNTNDNTITNMNVNVNMNDTDELTPHKGKLTIINDKAILTTTITTTTTNNAKDDMSDLHKIIEDNKERIIRNIKKIESAQHEHNNFNTHTNTNINTTPPSQLLNTSNITNTSIINNSKSSSSESILKIKEQLNNTTKKLGIALQRMVQQTEPKDDLQLQLQQQQTQTLLQQQQQQILAQNQMIEQMQKQLQMPLPTTTPPVIPLQPQPQQMLYTQQFIPIQPQQILTSYTLPFTPQQPQQTQFILQSQPLQSVNVIPQQQQQPQQPQYTYQSLISSLINNFQTLTPIDTSLYSSLTLAYRKLPSSQAKLTFISTLRNALDNHKTLLSQIPLNMFLTLYDFLLNLLSSEIILQQKDETVIIRLQELSEYLKQFKDLTNMFKLMMFLLRKYMPRNLNSKVSEHALVMIKVITYLLKELLKTFHEGKIAEAKEVIAEINELFLVTPPSGLTTQTPNANIYQQVYMVLKSMTDEMWKKYGLDEWNGVIGYLEGNKIVSGEYLSYLKKLLNKRN